MQPKPEALLLFIDCLMKTAPPDYKPWLFRCGKHSKVPATEYGSWKDEKNRLIVDEAIEWMLAGGNIGIAGMEDDPLVNVDLDGGGVRKEILKPTLTSRSRSRTGMHAFFFSEQPKPPNIPTDNDGEVRCRGQYVVAPGSYVPTSPNEVPKEYRSTAGYYTVEDARPPAWITYDDLPEVFRRAYEERQKKDEPQRQSFDPKQGNGRSSALFTITAEDVLRREVGNKKPSERWGSIFHDSKTEANMSISTKGLLHCWRHNVSHNGLQALTVLSGYMSCLAVGTPHKGGNSNITGNDGAIFHAWLYAKQHGYIPEDDPIPVRAMHYIAKKYLNYTAKVGELLPHDIYRQVLEIVERDY